MLQTPSGNTRSLHAGGRRWIIPACLVIGFVALFMVPTVGTHYGDVHETIALSIGVVFLVVALICYLYGLERRLASIEVRLGDREGAGKEPPRAR